MPSRTSSSPILIQCGYLQRTPRGRLLTLACVQASRTGAEPKRDESQIGLFGSGDEEQFAMTDKIIGVVAALDPR